MVFRILNQFANQSTKVIFGLLNISKRGQPVSSKVLTANQTALHARTMSSVAKSFEEAKNNLSSLKEEPDNDTKLQLYGLYKQAISGICNTPKPGMTDFVGKAKWNAWKNLGDMTQDEAKSQYINKINSLLAQQGGPKKETSTVQDGKYEFLSIRTENKITTIKLNRPDKKNAITFQMYADISLALKDAAADDNTSVVVLTGAGDYFSSGNDLSNFQMANMNDLDAMAKQGAKHLESFVGSFIDFPKPLVAAVNGPAVGILVTVLGLCDVVYASDTATFHTPFSSLGQSPEGCSTYTFPKIMGYSKANEILLFNKKFTAQEAKEYGLVAEVFPHQKFQSEIGERMKAVSELYKNTMIYSKRLIRNLERDTLHKINSEECNRLVERWQSQDCMEALMKFFQRKGKL